MQILLDVFIYDRVMFYWKILATDHVLFGNLWGTFAGTLKIVCRHFVQNGLDKQKKDYRIVYARKTLWAYSIARIRYV